MPGATAGVSRSSASAQDDLTSLSCLQPRWSQGNLKMGLFQEQWSLEVKLMQHISRIFFQMWFSLMLYRENFHILLHYFASFHSTDTVSKQVFSSKLLEMSHKINDFCLTFKYFQHQALALNEILLIFPMGGNVSDASGFQIKLESISI